MRWWPFGGDAPEPTDYTATIVAALERIVSAQTPDADPSLSAAVAQASMHYGAAFGGSTVAGDPLRAAALTPSVLSAIGAEYPRRGRADLIVEVDGALRLIPCVASRREDGRYDTVRLIDGRRVERIVRADELIRIAWSTTAPWTRAIHASQAAVNLERSLAVEGRLPVGLLLSLAGSAGGGEAADVGDELIDKLNRGDQGAVMRLPVQSGRAVLAPDDVSTPPASREGALTRMGPSYGSPGLMDGLHQQLVAAVLPTLGVPAVLGSTSAAATALRESRRHFYSATIPPLLAETSRVLSERLEAEITLTAPDIERIDVTQRARATASFASVEGIDAERALRLAGVEEPAA